MPVIHIWPNEPLNRGDKVEFSASIEIPNHKRVVLWYRIPETCQSLVPPTSAPFLMGTIFLLMQTGGIVHVHGRVAPSLIRNLMEYQYAWSSMLPGLKPVEIQVDLEQELESDVNQDRAILTFSGGVDSCFSAFRHARGIGVRFPRNLIAGVMVHGFDIPLDEREVFDGAVERSKRMLSSLGIELIPMATNYRELTEDWNHSHGAALASCLHLLSAGFSEGLIAQSYTYGELRYIAEGVNALTDPLLSSRRFRIVPDGAAQERADKITIMRDWAEFLSNLRVCWQGPRKDRNCCKCEKCIRNILTFRALGLGLPPCFEQDVSEEQIRTFEPGDLLRIKIRYEDLAKMAENSGAQGLWVHTLNQRINKVRRRSGAFRRFYHLPYYAQRILAKFN